MRARAKARLRHDRTGPLTPAGADLQEVVHELEVHQAELEMQNDELRRTQVELETARARLALLYNAAPVGYLTLDGAGVIREANLTAAQLLDCRPDQLLGKGLFRFVAPASQEAFHCFCRSREAAASQRTLELQLRRPDRSTFAGWLESHPEPPTPGLPQRFLVTLTDITERLRAQQHRAQLAAIVESCDQAIISRTLDDVIVSWNPASERMFGYTAEEIVGRPFRLLVPPEGLASLQAMRQRILQGERIEDYETERLTKDGHRLIITATTSPIKDGRGQIIGLATILRDSTRQKWVEAALRQSEAALSDFFDRAPLGLLWVSPDGRILRVNRAQLAMLGQAREGLFGRKLAEFSAPPKSVPPMLERLARHEALHNHRAQLRHRDGSLRHVLIDANGLWDKERMVHSRWFVRDVTRRLELEQEILAIGERVQQRIGQDLHDDLCQQLTCIEFLARSLERRLSGPAPAEAARAREVARLTRQAMTHTRELAHGMCPVDLASDGLPGALKELAARTRRLFRVDCRFRGNAPGPVGDAVSQTHLYRIAQEAVGNALKHGRPSRIGIRLRARGNKIVLGVLDNGAGLANGVDAPRGLGLRIMQYRAGVIGGTLTVRQGLKGGAAVVCSIPSGTTHPRTSFKP